MPTTRLDLQELMIIPVGAPSFREALRWGAETFHALKKILHDKGISTAVGDEGGFAPSVASHEAAIQMILEAIDKAGYTAGHPDRHGPGLRRQRVLQGRPVRAGRRRRPEADGPAWTDMLATWVDKYPIISIEDGMHEGDWDGWKHLTENAWARRCSWWATTCSSPTPRS